MTEKISEKISENVSESFKGFKVKKDTDSTKNIYIFTFGDSFTDS